VLELVGSPTALRRLADVAIQVAAELDPEPPPSEGGA
jgi:hypothetical protein